MRCRPFRTVATQKGVAAQTSARNLTEVSKRTGSAPPATADDLGPGSPGVDPGNLLAPTRGGGGGGCERPGDPLAGLGRIDDVVDLEIRGDVEGAEVLPQAGDHLGEAR